MFSNTPIFIVSLAAIPAATTMMWASSLFSLANRAAIKEALSIAGLCMFSFRQEIPVSAAFLSWIVVVISTALCAFVGFSYACSKGSRLLEAKRLGKTRLQSEPVFFRCRTHHTRLFPKKHSFRYSILEVGVPLGFHGSIGRLFSFNNGHDSKVGNKKWSLFGVDSRDYLKRGNETLEEKMRVFLRENDMNLEDYPTMYLVTAPRFLGYQFNPVSFWYLRNRDLVLSLVVVEVNNTFDERHMYILRPSMSPADLPTSPGEGKPVAFSNSIPKAFHVSPFNDRTGKYHILTRDPLSSHEDSNGLLNTVITLYDDAKNKKLVAAVCSVAPPIFVSDLSTSIVASLIFVVKFGWSGLITFPRIVWQASKLFGVKKLKVHFRPEVKGASISRNATALELQLEKYFRKYLQSRVRDHPHPIVVHYNTACIGNPPRRETFQSIPTSKSTTAAVIMEEIKITTFSPHFYVSWAASQSVRQALISGMLSKPEGKGTIEVSNLELAVLLLDGMENKSVAKSETWEYLDQRLTWRVIGGMREWFFSRQNMAAKTAVHLGEFGKAAVPPISRSNSPSVIDRRILALPNLDPRVYRGCIIQATLIETIGFGDRMLLEGWDIMIRGALVCLAWRGFVEIGILKPWGAIGGLVIWQVLKGFFDWQF